METTNYQGHHKTKTHCIRGHDRSISRIGEDCIVCDRERKQYPRQKYLRYLRDLKNGIQKTFRLYEISNVELIPGMEQSDEFCEIVKVSFS